MSTVRKSLARSMQWALALVACACAHGMAHAYVGPSYLRIEGVAGGAQHPQYRGWVRAESNYWTGRPELQEIRGIRESKNDLLFTGPLAPAKGAEMLAVSIDKGNPALARLKALCLEGKTIARLTFAEDSELARHPQEHGPRPADVPAFYEYTLRDVRLTCPEVAGAPEQAFGLHFAGIDWLNYRPQLAPRPTVAKPALAWPAGIGGQSRLFAVSWFAASLEGSPGQCPRMNTKPAQDDYFIYMPAEDAARLRAEFAAKGGVGPADMQFRGPDRMHVTLMPGIVADPGNVTPVSDTVPGLDLDKDGEIDNRLFTVEGCVEGFRRRGFLPMIFNEGRAVGRPTALVEVSGIDDPVNDPEVFVTVLYSTDELRRSPAKVVLADFTFRITDNPAYTQDFAQFRGKIENGAPTTEKIERLHVHEVTAIETTILQPRLRIEFLPDGRMKGLIGGYIDWRRRFTWQVFRASDYENTIGMQAPALYNALKRAADALPDPLTGELTAVSAAFDIEGVAAFAPAPEQGRLARQ